MTTNCLLSICPSCYRELPQFQVIGICDPCRKVEADRTAKFQDVDHAKSIAQQVADLHRKCDEFGNDED